MMRSAAIVNSPSTICRNEMGKSVSVLGKAPRTRFVAAATGVDLLNASRVKELLGIRGRYWKVELDSKAQKQRMLPRRMAL